MANLHASSVAHAYPKEWILIVAPFYRRGITEDNVHTQNFNCFFSHDLVEEMRKYKKISVFKDVVNRTPFSSMTSLQRAASKVLFGGELFHQQQWLEGIELSELFHRYIQEGNLFLASMMLAQQTDLSARKNLLLSKNEYGETALEWAVMNGRIQLCHRILTEAADLQRELLQDENRLRKTLLHLANGTGDTKMVRVLLHTIPTHLKATIVMEQDINGDTVLHQLARMSNSALKMNKIATTAKYYLNILTSAGIPHQKLTEIKNNCQKTAAELSDNIAFKELLTV